MLLQNQEAAERSSREEKNLYHLKESLVGGLELGEVRGSQETNTTPFNFIQLPQKVGGLGVGGGGGWGGSGFPNSRAGGREKYSKRGKSLNFMEYFHGVVLSLMVKHHFFSPWLIKK